ncbi:MAG: Hsp20/alpha crystallin family protein [Betaproteobacteria bacterium]|nr:Hsp20/alpha crystallin family protein [Betaproteobacteria bacterium]
MAESRDVVTKEKEEIQARREPEFTLRPQVDVFESAHGITIHADLPGVSNERLNLQVDKDTLKIVGDAVIDAPQAMEPLWAEVRSTRYERAFTLSAELDPDNISAKMKNGVLTVNIPKREEVRPRKIQVRVA